MLEHVTSVLELVALLLIVAAVGIAVAMVSVPLAFAASGASLLGISWLLTWRDNRAAARAVKP